MFKHRIPDIFTYLAPTLLWRVNTAEKTLFITFDDGPHPTITPKVLAILDEFNAKATFFCVGENVVKYPEVYNDIIQHKHSIGNHTYNHLSGYTTANNKYYQNVEQAAQFINSNLFRPPYGRITPLQIAQLKKKYSIVMWSLLTRDYEHNLNTAQALSIIIAQTKIGDVVVFHDSERAEKNMLYLLPAYLTHFKNLGYNFNAL